MNEAERSVAGMSELREEVPEKTEDNINTKGDHMIELNRIGFKRICKGTKCMYLPITEEGTSPYGDVMQALRMGFAIARKGWNGTGMFVYLVPAGAYPAQTGVAKEYFGDALVPYREYMALKTAQGDVATWAPSGSDALASDWIVYEEGELS